MSKRTRPDRAGIAEAVAEAQALFAQAEQLCQREDFAAAEPLLQRALSGFQANLDHFDLRLARTRYLLGVTFARRGHDLGARTCWNSVLFSCRVNGKPYELSIETLTRVVELSLNRGELKRAAGTARSAIKFLHQQSELDRLRLAELLTMRAQALAAMQDFREARAELQRAVEALEVCLGPGHRRTLKTRVMWAALCENTGRPTEARQHFERVIEDCEAAHGENDPDLVEPLERLMELCAHEGLFTLAQNHGVRLVRLEERMLGLHHPAVTSRLNQLAILTAKGGDDDGARRLFDHALTRLERASAMHHPTVDAVVSNLSGLLRRAGDEKSLRDLLERAVQLQERADRQPPFPTA